ncbi:MAG: methyltransferase domain-containing protein [Polyangiaceae bacterium]|nr:methyltransferase domain-containing protein [Polyangiaceae bacterium]MCW5789568.1 methyltransferase domain-containing protein [Polyangiaceae bacterium]
MRDEEGQPRVEALDDEAPPEIPDLSDQPPRSVPPPKPARADSEPAPGSIQPPSKPPSVQIPAVQVPSARPASLPPPPPSQRARAASDPSITVGSIPPPPLEDLDFDELPSDAPVSSRRPLSVPPPRSVPPPPRSVPPSSAARSTPPRPRSNPPPAILSAPVPKVAIHELTEALPLDEADVEPALDTVVEQERPSPPEVSEADAVAPSAPSAGGSFAAAAGSPSSPPPAGEVEARADEAAAAATEPVDGAAPHGEQRAVSGPPSPPEGASSPAEASHVETAPPPAAATSAEVEAPPAASDVAEPADAAAAVGLNDSEGDRVVSGSDRPGEPAASLLGAQAPPEVAAEETAPAVPQEPSAGVVIPDDAVPSGPMEVAPAPTSALMAMRIIRIGEPEAPPSEPEATDAEELSDDDLAPDSGRYVEQPLQEPPQDPSSAERGLPKPPPPPRSNKRPPPPRASDKERAVKEAAQKRKVRPWWEEIFGDDYMRTTTIPTRRQIAREVDFIESSLGVQPGGVVLDLACGSGEHAVELASRGFAVVGYDLSISQLAQAQEVAQERGQKLNFLQGDMREMAFEETFDAVYCWGSSFGYFEEEKNIQVAQRMLKALRPGGTLLLEVANRDYIAAQSPSSVWFEGDGCLCMDDAHLDWITSRLKVKRALMLDDGRSKEVNYSIRLYGLHELGKLLHDVGFVVRSASGQIATPGVFFGPSSPSLIVLAQRPA